MDVDALLSALRTGQLPVAARRWLITGLEAWQQGADLEAALGLDSAPLDRRDELLRVVFQLTPGGSDRARCAFVIECMRGKRHPSCTAHAMLRKLRASGVPIPQSVRHLTRIVNGTRAASWTENSVLCPTWPAPQSVANHQGEREKCETKKLSTR